MNKKQTLFIHLGMHKTGSTSIQDTLSNKLSSDVYTYLNLGSTNHNHRIYSLFSSHPEGYYLNFSKNSDSIIKFNEESKILIDKRIRECSTPNVILSGEDIINLSQDELGRLKVHFDNYFENIKVLAYVRSPTSYITSLFQQVVKSGVGFERFADENLSESNQVLNLKMLYPNYKRTFKKLEDVFGNKHLAIKSFNKQTLTNGNVVSDFTRSLGLPIDEEDILTSNEGISKPALSILYILRKASAMNLISVGKQQFLDVLQGVKTIKGEKLAFHSEALLAVTKPNAHDIEWIRNRGVDIVANVEASGQVNTENDLVSITKAQYRDFCLVIESLEIESGLGESIKKVVCEIGVLGNTGLFNSVENHALFSKIRSRIIDSHESADILREVAFAFENSGDIETAREVMKKAKMLRPNGPIIKQKLDDYLKKSK